MNQKIFYYTDELNNEFSSAKITPRTVDKNYKYIHKNPFWNAFSFLLQQILSVPFKFIYAKLKFHIRYEGKEKFKPFKNSGFFIFANHTQTFADTFIPSNCVFPKRNYFIVNPENVSIKGLGNLAHVLGAIPIPTELSGMKNFLKTIPYLINKKYSITIYPEAHIWPYYTKIRPFKTVSFKYPVGLNTPSFCVTNTYQAYGKKKNKVQIVSYIDGPFYPDKNLKTQKEKQNNLRNKIYNCMVERSKNSNIEVIKYVKKTN